MACRSIRFKLSGRTASTIPTAFFFTDYSHVRADDLFGIQCKVRAIADVTDPSRRFLMPIQRIVLGFALSFVAFEVFGALAPAPTRETHIEGEWKLNPQLSDDAQKALEARLKREHDRMMSMMREMDRRNTTGLPPLNAARDLPPPSEDARARMKRRRAQEEEIQHRMLAISDWLRIKQDSVGIELANAVEQRHVEPGTRSQVSMPSGELADERVGWDGDALVIDRDTSEGPDVVEKFRWLKATDQLEYRLAVGGDSELAGIKLKRIYDRTVSAVPPMNSATGPVR
jgi:hypothetical protein